MIIAALIGSTVLTLNHKQKKTQHFFQSDSFPEEFTYIKRGKKCKDEIPSEKESRSIKQMMNILAYF